MSRRADERELTRYFAALDEPARVELMAELKTIARSTMRSQRPGHTLGPTALVNEAYLKLSAAPGFRWTDLGHFLATAACAMRQVLVDHERARRRDKRGGGRKAVSLDPTMRVSEDPDVDLLDLDAAIAELERTDERRARVVVLRYFGGLDVEEVAEVMEISRTTVERDWRAARAWLGKRLGGDGRTPSS